jgi:hypothetical protein
MGALYGLLEGGSGKVAASGMVMFVALISCLIVLAAAGVLVVLWYTQRDK